MEYVLVPATVLRGSRWASDRGNPGSHYKPLRAAIAPRGVPGSASFFVGRPRLHASWGRSVSLAPAELVQPVVVDAEVMGDLVDHRHLNLVDHVVV